VTVGTTVEGLDQLTSRLEGMPQVYREVVIGNLMTLGGRVVYLCQLELEGVKYTGALERSLSSSIDPDAPSLIVGPTAPHSIFVRRGTRPHWAPIGPLKRWAAWKLGNENLAYPVRWSIHEYGTSREQMKKRGTMANPWPARVVARGDFQVALEATGDRIGKELAAAITE